MTAPLQFHFSASILSQDRGMPGCPHLPPGLEQQSPDARRNAMMVTIRRGLAPLYSALFCLAWVPPLTFATPSPHPHPPTPPTRPPACMSHRGLVKGHVGPLARGGRGAALSSCFLNTVTLFCLQMWANGRAQPVSVKLRPCGAGSTGFFL